MVAKVAKVNLKDGLTAILVGKIKRLERKLVSLAEDKKVRKDQNIRHADQLHQHVMKRVKVNLGVKNQQKEKNNEINKTETKRNY